MSTTCIFLYHPMNLPSANSNDISNNVTMDFGKMKVPDLKKELKTRGLNTSGNKNDLIERLQAALKSNTLPSVTDNVDDLDDDLLNEEDDDDVPLEGSESVISDFDAALNDTTSPPKRKSSENGTGGGQTATTKKLKLNRTTPIIPETSAPAISKVEEKSDIAIESSANGNNTEKKVIKFSSLSDKERLEMRAKKFDVPLNSDAKKVARAERFGITQNTSKIDTNVNTSVDVLKQRAERFGGSVSKVMSNLDLQEKMEKRKARFGIVTAEDKAKQRLERFKQPAN